MPRKIFKPYQGPYANLSGLSGPDIPQEWELVYTPESGLSLGDPTAANSHALTPFTEHSMAALVFGDNLTSPGNFAGAADVFLPTTAGLLFVGGSTVVALNPQQVTSINDEAFSSTVGGHLCLRGWSALTEAYLEYWEPDSVDIGENAALQTLVVAFGTSPTALTIDRCPKLELLNVGNITSMVSLDLLDSPLLSTLIATTATALTTLSVNWTAIETFTITGAAFTSLDVSAAENLGTFSLGNCSSLASLTVPSALASTANLVLLNGCNLDHPDLTAVFLALPDRSSTTAGTITVAGNPGAGSSDTAYVNAKATASAFNWTIIEA